jgi:hypothetical protein
VSPARIGPGTLQVFKNWAPRQRGLLGEPATYGEVLCISFSIPGWYYSVFSFLKKPSFNACAKPKTLARF